MSQDKRILNDILSNKSLKKNPRVIEIVVFFLILVIVLILGVVYYNFESKRIHEVKLREIAAIGDLKVKELKLWRNERYTDAISMAESPFVRRAIKAWMNNKSDKKLKDDLLERMNLEKKEKIYEDVNFLDTSGNVLLYTGNIEPKIYDTEIATIEIAKKARNSVFSNLYKDDNNQIYLDIISPVIIDNNDIIGYIILKNNAVTYLYPLISSWPVPSISSETVLSQRQGDSALFLNELKFTPNSALSLKVPLSHTEIPTVQAVLGKEGSFDGHDYRGVEVLANLRSVSDSPWFIVCKIDKEEGMKELRYRVFIIIFFATTLIVWLIIMFYLANKKFQSALYKKLFEKEQEVSQIIGESEEKFRTFFENITEGVALHEMIYNDKGEPIDYRIFDTNPAYFIHTNISAESAVGKLATELYNTSNPPYMQEFNKVAQTRESYRFETFYPPMQKHFMISVISPKVGQFATVFEDITERKKNEDELRKKNEELARFIYTISHDLKSPLVTIKSFTSYLLEDIEKQDQSSISKDIGYIQNAADKMGLLLDELLELSRIGRKGNPKKEIPLVDVARSVIDLVAGRIIEKKVKVTITETPVILFGDPQRLIQLYQNLIDNAVKFMGTQPNPTIEIGAENLKNEIVLFVRDNGSGIDPRYSHKLFGLFEKLDNKSDGTGIGLALVKRIVETHKGTIWFESDGPNTGVTFYFKLEKTRYGNQ